MRWGWGGAFVGWGVLVSTAIAATPGQRADEGLVSRVVAQLEAESPDVGARTADGRITRLFGSALARGSDALESAELFCRRHAAVFGANAEDLSPAGLRGAEDEAIPLVFDRETGTYKFTLVRYRQRREGVPVFGADLRLLVRNEAVNPVVLAASNLRSLGAFIPEVTALPTDLEPSKGVKRKFERISPFELVIWAGLVEQPAKPRLAYSFVTEHGTPDGEYERWLYVADAETGAILHQEDLVVLTDIDGSIAGLATEGSKADICAPEATAIMPYAAVSISGSDIVYADTDGLFAIPNNGTEAVVVQSPMSGRFFYVSDMAGTAETLSQSITPPGPAAFEHNAANAIEAVRAQTNAYIQANVVRNFALAYNPSYPTIAAQTDFPLYVNRTDGYCPANAWYDGSALNFCSSSGSYPNTAFASVVHHEYGHHLVACGGSGQGAYGEGMGDSIAMLIADDPVLGYGLEGDCATGIRSADNAYQYPCTGDIHECGQLLSGCIWGVRDALAAAYPAAYRDLIANLTINSILLHTFNQITPDIVVDFLTLDDDDGNIRNGTPHRAQICAGFEDHNMECPALEVGLRVAPAGGIIAGGPSGGPFAPASASYTLENLGPIPSLEFAVDQSPPWLSISSPNGTIGIGQTVTVTVSVNAYANSLPDGRYVDSIRFVNRTDHTGDVTSAVTLNVGVPMVVYEWNLDTDPGWVAEGQWTYGQPRGAGSHNRDPGAGRTGTNVYGYNLAGDYANGLPVRHLTSDGIDCTGLYNTTLSFYRWLGVESHSSFDEATVEASNDGVNWTMLWQATSTGTDISDSSWQYQQFDIAAIADNEPAVRIRWGLGRTDNGVTYPGWNIDDIQIAAIDGQTPPPLRIVLPDGVPPAIPPGHPTSISVHILDGAQSLVPGSGTLHYRFEEGPFRAVPLLGLGGNDYQAVLPATGCNSAPEFYVSAVGSGGGIVYSPDGAPAKFHAAPVGVFTTLLADDFESDRGWTVGDANDNATMGVWNRADPEGTSAQPENDHTPAPGLQCWVTDSRAGSGLGDYDVDGGATTLRSPIFDLTACGDATVRYYRWYSNDAGNNPNTDILTVDISSNGGESWTNVETIGPAGAGTSGGWIVHAFQVADFVKPTGQIGLRFVAADTNPSSLVEAALDDFELVGFQCTPPAGDGDYDGDGDIDLADFGRLQKCFGQNPMPGTCYPGDLNASNSVTQDDFDLFEPQLGRPNRG